MVLCLGNASVAIGAIFKCHCFFLEMNQMFLIQNNTHKHMYTQACMHACMYTHRQKDRHRLKVIISVSERKRTKSKRNV